MPLITSWNNEVEAMKKVFEVRNGKFLDNISEKKKKFPNESLNNFQEELN